MDQPSRTSASAPPRRPVPAAVARAAASAAPRVRAAAVAEALEPRRLLAVDFDFTIIDPGQGNEEFYDDVNRILNAAANDWSQYIDSTATIELNVFFQFNTVNRVPTFSGTNGFEVIREEGEGEGAIEIVEIGPVHEIRTGADPNGGFSDGFITFNTALIGDMFFDPSPLLRTAPVPEAEYDAYSAVLEELGHILGFSGYKDPFTGAVEGRMSTYDELVQFTGPQSVIFTGETAEIVNGGDPVPLTYGDVTHYGNEDGPGEELLDNLMSPSVEPGEREFITDIDLAMLIDIGMPMNFEGATPPPPPAPPTLELAGTNRADIIEVVHTGSQILLNVTNFVTRQRINPFTGQTEQFQSYETSRTPYPAAGFTEIIIRGLRGNDRIVVNGSMLGCYIYGGDGNDTIIGSNNNDTLYGDAGNDQLYGGYGEDRLDGSGGQDYLFGGFDNDRLYGNDGHDTLDAGAGDDRLWGGFGNDQLIGGNGNDWLLGEWDADELYGAEGRDRLDGGAGGDLLDGGNGVDTADYLDRTRSVTVTLDENPGDGVAGEGDNVKYNVENVWGGVANDRLVGTGANNVLYGGPGQDSIDGGRGNDVLLGSDGADVMDGQIGNDTIEGGAGADRMVGNDGFDLLIGGIGNDRIFAVDRRSDTISGGAGDDEILNDELDVVEDAGI